MKARKYHLTCNACGVTFPNRGAYMNHGRYSKTCTDEARFWSRVDKSKPDGCWPWTGYRQKFGHGYIGRGRRWILAHRYAWELVSGPIPDGMWVLHKCDNPPCCNPAHLYIGDRSANMADCYNRRRHTYGEKNSHAILTEKDVLEILQNRPKPRQRGAVQSIAAKYGVSINAISAVLAGRSWKFLTRNPLSTR